MNTKYLLSFIFLLGCLTLDSAIAEPQQSDVTFNALEAPKEQEQAASPGRKFDPKVLSEISELQCSGKKGIERDEAEGVAASIARKELDFASFKMAARKACDYSAAREVGLAVAKDKLDYLRIEELAAWLEKTCRPAPSTERTFRRWQEAIMISRLAQDGEIKLPAIKKVHAKSCEIERTVALVGRAKKKIFLKEVLAKSEKELGDLSSHMVEYQSDLKRYEQQTRERRADVDKFKLQHAYPRWTQADYDEYNELKGFWEDSFVMLDQTRAAIAEMKSEITTLEQDISATRDRLKYE